MKIGLYIHIPFCHSKCYYCDFLSFPGAEKQQAYTEVLIKEIKNVASTLGKEDTVKSIFIGGGTPTVLPPILLDKICTAIENCFILEKDTEWTIEANPGTLTDDLTKVINTHAITRVSMGLQSTHNRLLKLIGRIHTFEDWEHSIDLIKTKTSCEVNADMMFALPTQTYEEFETSLDTIVRYPLDHLSLYALIIEEGTKFGHLYAHNELDLVDEVLDRKMYHHAKAYLKEAGYEQYEISNFAKTNKECKHNILYWERGPYIGMGLGAHSLFNETRYHNVNTMKEYLASNGNLEYVNIEKEIITKKMAMEEFMFLGLRKTKGISTSRFKELFKEDVLAVYKSQLEKWINYNILVNNKERIYLSDYGMDICNEVFSSFL